MSTEKMEPVAALDNIKAALEAGPTDGPWKADQWTSNEGDCYGWAFSAGGFRLPLSDIETDDPRECDANAAFIAACNPSAIRELLAYVESMEMDAARYRWLRDRCRRTPEHWGGRWSIVIDGPAPQQGPAESVVDAAVDAAIQASKPPAQNTGGE